MLVLGFGSADDLLGDSATCQMIAEHRGETWLVCIQIRSIARLGHGGVPGRDLDGDVEGGFASRWIECPSAQLYPRAAVARIGTRGLQLSGHVCVTVLRVSMGSVNMKTDTSK